MSAYRDHRFEPVAPAPPAGKAHPLLRAVARAGLHALGSGLLFAAMFALRAWSLPGGAIMGALWFIGFWPIAASMQPELEARRRGRVVAKALAWVREVEDAERRQS